MIQNRIFPSERSEFVVGAPPERHSLCLPEHHFRNVVVVFVIIHVNDDDLRINTFDLVVDFERGIIIVDAK